MLILERFEGDKAVIETDTGHVTVPRDALPSNAREGDVLQELDGVYTVDKVQTDNRRAHITALQNSLFKPKKK